MPKMAKIRQTFPRRVLEDVGRAVAEQFSQRGIKDQLVPGSRIAITAGSRGITDIVPVLRALVALVKEQGCYPFLFNAMGSHGGSNAEGQEIILEKLGITTETIGAPIVCSMDLEVLTTLPDGTPIYIDKNAAGADGIILVNRIKPHTGFRHKYESGLVKMAVIGMGKQKGAETCHHHGWGHMHERLDIISEAVFSKAKILFGVGIIESAYDETAKVVFLPKDEIVSREPQLLAEARNLMASLPVETLDVLVVDRIGKNISGDGLDPNITGTHFTPYHSGGPQSENVVILDLTDESHGSAIGIGAASVTTKRFFDKIDFEQTYPNCLTSKVLSVAKIPLIAISDQAAISAAIYACALADREKLRILRIRDSLHVDELYVSETLLLELRGKPSIEVLEEPEEWVFDEAGNLF